MTSVVLDALARPRIAVVVDDGEPFARALAARTLTLALLHRLPLARVVVGTTTAGREPPASHLDCGRPPRRLDGERLDAVVVVGDAGAEVQSHAERNGCPLVRIAESCVDVAPAAVSAMGDALLRNRAGTLRLLGWLPAAGLRFVAVDVAAPGRIGVVCDEFGGPSSPRVIPEEAGVDEVVAALDTAAEYTGGDAVLRAVAAGADQVSAGLDAAAAAALDTWRSHGSPDAVADPAPWRRAAAESAALRVEIDRLERELESLSLHTNHLDTELRRVVESKSWRYTESARGLYRAARRRMGGGR